MQGGVHAVELVFLLLLLFVVVFGALAVRLKTPYPIVLVIAGLVLSFVPGIPKITLNPEVVFFIILPPLLFNAAWLTSWREFRYNLVSIFFLAFGLVTFTVISVATAVEHFLPGFDWRMGVVLGAVVAPTDAIAATSIARRVGLPKRIVEVLEGESLINDASALLALEFGIAMLVRGQNPTVMGGIGRLAILIAGGIVVGVVIGEIVHLLEHAVEHAPIEIALSILTPYAAYLAAESIHASGVLAVVTCGLILSRHSSHFFSANVRLQAWAVWDSLSFVLNGLVFVLIGLQLPFVREGIEGYSLGRLIVYGAVFSAFLIFLRLLWTFPGAHVSYFIRRRILHQDGMPPTRRQIFVVGWTGMRGVISLAAAIALPRALADGSPFQQRNMITFLAFCVILVTLVLQGLTLPPLIRALGLAGAGESSEEEKQARQTILQAALKHLEEAQKKDRPESRPLYEDFTQHYRNRLATVKEDGDGTAEADPELHRRFTEISRQALHVERHTAVQLRNQGRISDELLRKIERELDLDVARLLE